MERTHGRGPADQPPAGRRRGRPPRPPLVTGFEDFEDDPDAPFYRSQARRLSPRETWNAIAVALARQLVAVGEETKRGPIAMTPERILGWHRSLFGKDFPHAAGVVRPGPVWFPVTYVEAARRRHRQVAGTDPSRIRTELRTVCDAFNTAVRQAQEQGGEMGMHAGALVAAQVYAEILAVHPFDDGNGRTAYIALSAALRSLGLWRIHFQGARQEHDDCLGWALRPDDRRTYEPLTELLVRRIKDSAEAHRRGTIEP